MAYDTRFYGLGFSFDSFNGMPYVQLGGCGLRVSCVGLGTWKVGYPERGDKARVGRDQAFRILDRALELGATFWDTANRYNEASGNSERVLGEWFRAHPGERRNIVLATKMAGAMDGVTPNHSGLSRANILDSVYASLDRLDIDHIDLLQFHRPDPDTPVEESLEAVADLRRRDLVRYLGISNANVEDLMVYRELAHQFGLPLVASVQNNFNPLDGEREGQRGVLAFCARNRLAFIPYSPLSRGLLTNRYLPGRNVGQGDRLVDEGALEKMKGGQVTQQLSRLGELAQQEGFTVAQLSLAYLLRLPGMGPLIPSASTVEQLEENSRAATIELRAGVLEQLSQIFVTTAALNLDNL
ncbi:MAG: aldo/keto reductase [Candidatus Latescibacteria bacterium]|nr:aldo/keto reductase [Candidatus Latescibacterota bacterium]